MTAAQHLEALRELMPPGIFRDASRKMLQGFSHSDLTEWNKLQNARRVRASRAKCNGGHSHRTITEPAQCNGTSEGESITKSVPCNETAQPPTITEPGVKEAGSFPLDPQSPEETSTPRKKPPTGVKKEGSPPVESVPLPAELVAVEGFDGMWRTFIESRRLIKKPMTYLAAERILRTLSHRPAEAVAGLDLAIEKQWQGFNWQWVENSRGSRGSLATITSGKSSGSTNADEAELGNARMAYYGATGKPPFGMADDDVLKWFADHLVSLRAA